MSALLEKIKSRGYWKIVIRPVEFDSQRVQRLSALEASVRESTVSLRGWNFPQHDDSRLRYVRGADSTGQELDWSEHVEMWRAYKSGQFVALAAIWGEWRDKSEWVWVPVDPGWRPGATLSVEDAVYRITEIFEFAARYSDTAAGSDTMLVRIELKGLLKRQLGLAPNKVGFMVPQMSSVNEWQWERRLTRFELHARTRELAFKPASDLFEKFGWDAKEEVLKNIQDQLRK